MNQKTLPIALFFLSLFAFTITFAQDPDSAEIAKRGTLTISGSGDVYYRYDMVGHNKSNNYTSFTNSHNSFELGMLSAKIEYNYKGVGGCLDMGFGKRALE